MSYSPTIGRFIETDPDGYAASGPNLYNFCGDNPLIYTDPSGLQASQPAPADAAAALTQKAMAFTRPNEGYSTTAYRDNRGFVTVGIGFNMDASNNKGVWPQLLPGVDFDKVYSGKQALSGDQVDTLFAYSIAKAIASAQNQVPNLNEHPAPVQLVLIDMSFQLGSLVKFKKLCAALANKDYRTAANEMENSKWATQTPQRAQRNIAIVRAAASQPAQ